jgi:peroxiredoxin Q/BCP
MIEAGEQAPDFTLADQAGNEVTLSGLRGRKVVLYFYPKDDTSGCTTQACGLRDRSMSSTLGAVVLGVSPDSAASHAIPHENTSCLSLCSRTPVRRRRAVRGVAGEVDVRTHVLGRRPHQFVIGADGRRAGPRKVKPAGHAERVLELLSSGSVPPRPGSCSIELGAGFDCIGLALDRYLEVRFEPGPGAIRVERAGTLASLDPDAGDEDAVPSRVETGRAIDRARR